MDWPHHVEEILGNDVCVALGYRTPAAGVVLTPVSTVGMHDPTAGTVSTTSSFGNCGKLAAIDHDDRVALVYHTREHSSVAAPHLLVVQGHASFPITPPDEWAPPDVLERLERFMPARRSGRFWDWAGREYYERRVTITIAVHRIVDFGPDDAARPSEVIGAPLPPAPEPQPPPSRGTGPRVAYKRYSKRLRKCRHHLVGYTDAEGFPMANRVEVERSGDSLAVTSPALPSGGRRAGLLAHWFEPQLVGQGSVVMTGWLDVEKGSDLGSYSVHTTTGYEVPANELIFALGGELVTKLGYRKAVKAGLVRDGIWQRPAG